MGLILTLTLTLTLTRALTLTLSLALTLAVVDVRQLEGVLLAGRRRAAPWLGLGLGLWVRV